MSGEGVRRVVRPEVTAQDVARLAAEVVGVVPEFSLCGGELEIFARPRALTGEELERLTAALDNMVVAVYRGVVCGNGAEVDRVTDAAISRYVAPGKPGDLQRLERERLLAESVAILMAERLSGQQTAENTARLAANWARYLEVMRLSAEGTAFKLEHGMG